MLRYLKLANGWQQNWSVKLRVIRAVQLNMEKLVQKISAEQSQTSASTAQRCPQTDDI
jgi:hypothetical protein